MEKEKREMGLDNLEIGDNNFLFPLSEKEQLLLLRSFVDEVLLDEEDDSHDNGECFWDLIYDGI